MSGRVFDCFTFDHEFDLLELRLRELDGVADYHVLVEAPSTFAGCAKPLHYQRCAAWFREWHHKIIHRHHRIIHHVVDFLPEPGQPEFDPYGREHRQRQAIGRALRYWAEFNGPPLAAGDVVLVSDADEIPNRRAVAEARKLLALGHEAVALNCRFFECYMDTVLREDCPSILAYRGDVALDRNFSHDKWAAQKTREFQIIDNGGWHFSGLGGPWRVWEKHTSYAEPTPADHEFVHPARLATVLGGAWSVVDRDFKLKLVDVDETYPADVLRRPERWRPFMYRPESFMAKCGNPAAPRPTDC
jgi:beta-1,4-mannosyl-glycoprotein beta-1,4-N-acetylglucosaminyltransferase